MHMLATPFLQVCFRLCQVLQPLLPHMTLQVALAAPQPAVDNPGQKRGAWQMDLDCLLKCLEDTNCLPSYKLHIRPEEDNRS